MIFELQDKKISEIKADVEIVLVFNKNLKHKWIYDAEILKEQNFKGGNGEICFLPHKNRLYLGMESFEHDDLRSAGAKIDEQLIKKKYKTLKIGLYGDDIKAGLRGLVEGFLLGSYRFDKYKSKKEKLSVSRIIFSSDAYESVKSNVKELRNVIREAEIIAKATNYTRDIVNTIPADINPITMSEIAKNLAKNNGLTVKVYGEKYIKEEGMGAFLAVSKASPYPPQLIHLTYKPKNPKFKIAIVGKGLTFDTGGLSLKPSASMLTMKSDKSGGSAVFGILKAASELNLPIEIHGVVGAVENAIGQHAYKPDDILRAKNGKTIEVKDTDAEGRLVLADCLCYAQELKPDYIIDLATLTGACIVALGEYTIGIMGHSDDFKYEMIKAARSSGELVGDLPFNKYLSKLLKSDVADMSNISAGRFGGAITAGLFLSEFINNEYKDKWLHLDIAGPAYIEKPWGYNPYGASGAGVRIIIDWLKEKIN